MNITILGAGALGTSLAITLSQRHNVLLWGRNPEIITCAKEKKENTTYLPGVALPKILTLSSDLSQAIEHITMFSKADQDDALLFVASPVAALRQVLQRLHNFHLPNIICLCKGFEENTRLLPHQILHQILGNSIPIATLSGPSFAQEVALGLPCSLSIASTSTRLREQVVKAVQGGNICVDSTNDIIGAEVGGAVKNVLAIATGLTDNLGLNAQAALITRGLAEATRFGVALGGHTETFVGLSGIGDLMLTCTGSFSRNRRVGLGLAQGKKLSLIKDELGHVAEGVYCAASVHILAQEYKVKMPIVEAVNRILFEDAPLQIMAELLLSY
jgi:glycerol-3-phosphate dehydrogenase (NAD(P)+)